MLFIINKLRLLDKRIILTLKMTKFTNNVMLLRRGSSRKGERAVSRFFHMATVFARSRTWKSIGAMILKEMMVGVRDRRKAHDRWKSNVGTGPTGLIKMTACRNREGRVIDRFARSDPWPLPFLQRVII